MSPVSTTQDLLTGMTGKRASALPFDPIASRNADRPKFRLEDYAHQEAKEAAQSEAPRKAPPSRADDAARNEDSRRNRDAAPARENRNASSADKPAHKDDRTAEVTSKRPDETGAKAREDVSRDDQIASAPSADAPKVEKPAKSGSAGTEAESQAVTAAEAEQQTKTGTAPTKSETMDSAAPNAPSESVPSSSQANSMAQESKAADGAATGQNAPYNKSDPHDARVQQSSNAAAQGADATLNNAAGAIPASSAAANNVTQAKAAEAAAAPATQENQLPNQAAASAKQSADPKLAALQKLTQTAQDAAAATGANTRTSPPASDDKTTLTLPVPWPQKTAAPAQASAPQADNGGQTSGLPADAVARAVRAAADAANSNGQAKAPAAEATAAKAAGNAAAQASQQPLPKIEIDHSAAGGARMQVSNEATLIANSRQAGLETNQKPAVLLSQSETIAAVTALNSRVPRSNALGAVPQSNALNASAEKAAAQITAKAAQTPAGAAVAAGATLPTAPTGGNAPAFTAGQQPAVSIEQQPTGGRSQGGTGQGSLGDSGSSTGSTARAGEMPSNSSTSSFGDTLRANGSERAGAPQETRQPLPGAAAEQVKVKLVKAAQGGLDKMQIQLRPSELGKVDIRLEFGSDGGVRGIVTVEKPETLQLLQRDARQLEQALQDAGFKTGGDSLEFQMRGGDTYGRQQFADSGNSSLPDAGGDLTAEEDQLGSATAGTEQDGVGEDGSLNMVA